ncbi:hypothetical protein Tco_0228864 [Tanacetum coccineum]
MDDLYNNLKIYEAEVKGSSSTSQNTQNVAFVSSNNTSSTNEVVKTAHGVFAANSKANASTSPNIDSLSDIVIYSFFASHSNNSQLIDPDDLEEMDLKWQMAMLTLKARRFLNKTGRNLGTDTIGFDKTKCDGLDYDWSDQAEEGPTNFALMPYTSSGAYKAGLELVEARLEVYKNNEAVFEEDIKILKLDVMLRDKALTKLRKKFEKAEKERDDLKLTLEKFENSSKNLSKLLEIQVSDKFKTGVGFDSQVFDSQVNDKNKTGEGESVTNVPVVATSETKTSESKPKSCSEPIIEDWISDSEDEYETQSKSKQRKPSFAKVEFVKSNEYVKSPRESVKKVEYNKQAKYPRKNSQSPRDCDFYEKKMVKKPVWNNARRVNHQNSQRLTHPHPKGNFVPKAVLMKSGLKTVNIAQQNYSKAAVSVNTARPINTAFPRPTVNCAKPASNVFTRAHSHIRRLFNKFTTNKYSNFKEKFNNVKGNVTTVGPKAVVSNNKGNEANAVKTSACWVWRPKHKVLDHVYKNNDALMSFKRFDYVDA